MKMQREGCVLDFFFFKGCMLYLLPWASPVVLRVRNSGMPSKNSSRLGGASLRARDALIETVLCVPQQRY